MYGLCDPFSFFYLHFIEFFCKYPNVGMGYDADVNEKVW